MKKELTATTQNSRRDFLKRSATLAAATTVAPLVIQRSAHAAGSDILKVGLIGCGGRGSGAAVNAMNAGNHLAMGPPSTQTQHVRRGASGIVRFDPIRRTHQQRSVYGPQHDARHPGPHGRLHGKEDHLGGGDEIGRSTRPPTALVGHGTPAQTRPRRHLSGAHAGVYQRFCMNLTMSAYAADIDS